MIKELARYIACIAILSVLAVVIVAVRVVRWWRRDDGVFDVEGCFYPEMPAERPGGEAPDPPPRPPGNE